MVAALAESPAIAPRPGDPERRLRLVGPDERLRPPDRSVWSARPSAATYRHRRLGVAVTVLAVVGFGLWIALQAALGGVGGGPLTAAGASPGSTGAGATHAWVVRPGDTLWSIALAVHPHGDERPLVDRLSAEVKGQPIVAGERLALP